MNKTLYTRQLQNQFVLLFCCLISELHFLCMLSLEMGYISYYVASPYNKIFHYVIHTNLPTQTHAYTHTHTQGLNKQSYEFFMMQNKSAYIFHNPAIQPTTIQNDYHVMFKIDHVTILLL